MTNIQYQPGSIDAGACISNGWNLIKPNYWLYFGIVALMVVAGIVLSCIPFLPILLQVFVMTPLTVGIFAALFREMRQEPIDFGMFFNGFNKFVPAMVIGAIHSVPSIILFILNIVFRVASIIPRLIDQSGRHGRSNFVSDSDAAPLIAGGVLIVFAVVFIVFMIFSIAWGITFFFAIPVLADNDIGAIDAIKLGARAGWSNVGGIVLLIIIEIGIGLIGALAICVGLLFVIPLLYAANAFAYRQVFPLPPNNRSPGYAGGFGSGM